MLRRFRQLVLSILFLMTFPLTGLAQDFTHTGSAYGGIGAGKFYDDEGSLGRGLTYRAGVEWRPISRIGLEADLLGIHFTRSDYFNVRGNTQYIFTNGIYYFSVSGTQPYIKGGIGLFRTAYSYSWPASSSQEFHASKTGIALDFGAGIRFFVNRRWSINPDLRLVGGASGYALVSYFSLSAAYHW